MTLNGGAGAGGGTVTIDGNLTTADGGALAVTSNDAAATQGLTINGNSGVTIAASGGNGIGVGYTGSGATSISNSATITSGTAGANTLENGIIVLSTGTGNVSVTNGGSISSSTDRAQADGIHAQIINPASSAAVTVTGNGAIWSAGDGIDIQTSGSGFAGVQYTGSINSSGGRGIAVSSQAGNAAITTGGGTVTTAAGDALSATSTNGNIDSFRDQIYRMIC